MSLLLLLPVKTRFPRKLRCNEEEDEVEEVEACKEMSKLSISRENLASPPDARMLLR